MSRLLLVSMLWSALAACGSSSNGAATPKTAPPPPHRAATAGPSAVEIAQREHDEREAIVENHRKLEAEEQDALAVSCDRTGPPAHERCLPSCYPTEPADARAGHKLAGAVEIEHLACQGQDGLMMFADELAPAKLGLRPVRGRIPSPHKMGSWQAEIESSLHDKVPRGDVVVVAGAQREVTHPLTHEVLQCASVSRYIKATHRALDGCGGVGDATCEAAGNAAARAINVVHYRLEESRRLQAAGNTAGCQQASLEAIAVARGLPRWRQYAKLNVHAWTDNLAYRTRFDGTLDEEAVFAATAKLGAEAEAVYAACGGAPRAPTTPEQEQSFHACW